MIQHIAINNEIKSEKEVTFKLWIINRIENLKETCFFYLSIFDCGLKKEIH